MPLLRLEDGYVDLDGLTTSRGGRFEALTQTEGRLLRYLWERKGVLISREELLSAVWGYRKGVRSRTLDTYIWRLRRKLEVDPSQPLLLRTEARQGVRLCPPPAAADARAGSAVVVVFLATELWARAQSDADVMPRWTALRASVLEQSSDRGLRPMDRGEPAGVISLEGIAAEPALGVVLSVLSTPAPAVGPLVAGMDAASWTEQGRSVALLAGQRRARRLASVAFPGSVLASLGCARMLPPRRMVAIGQLPLSPGAVAEPLFTPLPSDKADALPPLDVAVFGRDAEVAALTASEAGLMSLVGPGGIGKSTLARAWASQALESGALADVVYCELGEDASPADLSAALARALEVNEDRIPSALRARGALILLDGADGAFPDGAAQLSRWRMAAQRCRWLVTCRAPLGLPDEQVVTVQPLSAHAASAMLLDRVAGQPGYGELAPSDDVVADLVAVIGGNPLALELASNRARLFPPQQLLARLRAEPDLISGEVSRRSGSSDGAVAFSWSLLSGVAREGLARLALFPGDLSIDAAEAALAGLPGLSGPPTALIEELADASLLQLRHDPHLDDVRLLLLDPVRAFARARLSPASARQCQEQFARWLADASTRWRAQAMAGPQQYDALRSLRAEQHNLLFAFDALAADAPETGLVLLEACLPLIDDLQTLSPGVVSSRLERLPMFDGDIQHQVQWLRCNLQSRLRPHADVSELVEALLAVPDLPPALEEPARVLRLMGWFLAGQIRRPHARAELDALRALFEEAPLPPWRFALSTLMGFFFSQLPNGLRVSQHIAEHTLRQARQMGSPLTSDRLELYLGKVKATAGTLQPEEIDDLLKRCRRMIDAGARAIAQPYLLNIARAQLALSGPHAAAPTIAAVHAQAARAGDDFALTNITRLKAEMHLMAGRTHEARQLITALVEDARGTTASTFHQRALLRLALVELLDARTEAGMACLAELRRSASTDYDTFHIACIRAAMLARSAPDKAATALQNATPPTPACDPLIAAAAAWIEPERADAARRAAHQSKTLISTGNSGFILRVLLKGLEQRQQTMPDRPNEA
ncbi:MAG: winged helix-turn-helix domain-containing protein [Myxococcota bacterium]